MMSDAESVILSEISGIVKRLTNPDSDGAFLYAEAGDGMVAPSLFKDVGSTVRFVSALHELAPPIQDLWYAAEGEKKWVALFLTIQGNQFDARFQYAEDWDNASEVERRDRVLAAKYGNKTIYYPPLEGE